MKTNKFVKYLKENGLYLGILAFMLICFLIPYFATGLPRAEENDFHYARLISMVETLKLGIFPPKIRPMLMMGFGYGVGFFYPDFFLYIAVALVMLGVEPMMAFKIFASLVAIVGAIVCYMVFDGFIKSKKIAVVTTILYFGTICMWNNLYDGFGIGAFIAQVVLPLAFCGLLRAFDDEKAGYIQYGIGITAVVLSHHLTFISMMVAMVLLVLLNIKKIITNPKVLGKLFCVSMVGLFFSTQYWLPAIELAAHTKFKVIYDNFIDINDHILNFFDVIREISWLYFVLFLVATVVFVWLMVKNRKVYLNELMVFITVVFHMGLMRSEPFWRGPVGQFFSFFQSTARLIYVLMVLLIMFLAMVAKLAADDMTKDGKKVDVKPLILVAISVVAVLGTRMYIKPNFYNPKAYDRQVIDRDLILVDNGISCGEWLPVENEPSECHGVENAGANDQTSADGYKHDNYRYFEVWVDLSKEYYDMPYIYYYGYRAYILDENDNPVSELKVGEAYDDNGYVRVFMPEGGQGFGHVMVQYQKTTLQKVAYVITGLTTVLFVAWLIWHRKRIAAQ